MVPANQLAVEQGLQRLPVAVAGAADIGDAAAHADGNRKAEPLPD